MRLLSRAERWPARVGPSADRSPGAVRIAASLAAGDLGLAIDIDRVGVRAALQAIRLISRPGNNRTVAAGVRIAPSNGSPRSTAFERLHLRGVGPLLVLVVHTGADAVADHAADRRAGEAGREPLAGAAAELRPDEAAGNGANERAGVLLGALAGFRRGGAGGERHCHDCSRANAND